VNHINSFYFQTDLGILLSSRTERIGKKAVLNHHREVPYHLLKSESRDSVNSPGSGNLLVEGDNLIALKALKGDVGSKTT
jgi:hypothetical protein